MLQEKAKAVVDARDCYKRVPHGKHPQAGEYVITGLQAGNLRGEQGWHKYIGYVVQIRKKAGAFGSDLILLRHPDGSLMRHENQDYCRMDEFWLAEAKALFPVGMTPDEYEDYSEAYTLGKDGCPEIGKVIEAKPDNPPRYDAPMMQITIASGDGSREVIVV